VRVSDVRGEKGRQARGRARWRGTEQNTLGGVGERDRHRETGKGLCRICKELGRNIDLFKDIGMYIHTSFGFRIITYMGRTLLL
jgi:hypothetical protein